MDRFDAMQAFVRVVDAGSFTKAAQTLHMSKTTVTQLVQQLEARLRVKLLTLFSPWTMAMLTLRPVSLASVFSGSRITWPSPISRRVNWCRCLKIGSWTPCRCTWHSRRTGM